MAAAPRRRPIDPQPAHPDPGFREAERSGLGAAGTGNHRGDHRRVPVHGGQGRGPEPPRRGEGGGGAVCDILAAQVQYRAGYIRRHSDDAGAAHHGSWIGDGGGARLGAPPFVPSLPPKFNIALVTFAGPATTLVPPTMDHGSVTAAIRSLRPQASTAIGEGIYTSLAALAQVPPDPDNPKAVPPARIVLLSDGKTQVGRPSDEAAMAAKAQSVPIHTIAYGTPEGYIDIGGRREPVPVDRAELARVSKISAAW